jgi:hypothetical protein
VVRMAELAVRPDHFNVWAVQQPPRQAAFAAARPRSLGGGRHLGHIRAGGLGSGPR